MQPPPPPTCPANLWTLDLNTGAQTGALLPGSGIISTGPGITRRVVGLDLRPTALIQCTKANIVVEYEGIPTDWTVNIGDSPTNNGFGGGASGTTLSCAEVQVVNNAVSAFKHCPPPASGGALPLLPNPNPLSLKDGSLKFVVQNNYLSVGQPFASATSAESFHIPDTLGPNPDGSKIYAAFNRVISGPGDRIGTGVRRVMITLE
jgi:hypothetical protein